jgi:hypothetical protein
MVRKRALVTRKKNAIFPFGPKQDFRILRSQRKVGRLTQTLDVQWIGTGLIMSFEVVPK